MSPSAAPSAALTDLPVEACIPALRDALGSVGAAVLQAAPGAGKSTIVPLRLLGEPWLAGGRIVMLEPRRLATRATARRMAHLLGEEVGATVGYRTRDERRVGPGTRIEVVTEGILTRRLQRDPSLPGTGLVIFDEVHERNLPSDLALALTVDVRGGLRPDLAVLAMSATLEAAALAALLGGVAPPVPIVRSADRLHPVEIRWRAPDHDPGRDAGRRDRPARGNEDTAAAIRSALRTDPGDVLVFLPGAAEIRRVATLLGGSTWPADTDVRPLHGSLPVADQDAALAPSPPGRRRVILSTDIAETSLTVEGVRIVVDAGRLRRPRYDRRSGMARLHTSAASRASADQRAGRAGRLGPGIAYRLWSEADHATRRPFAEAEIETADLAGLALELAVWGTAPDQLAFLDAPPPDRYAEANALLHRLGALDGAGRPTDAGRAMVELPLHPRLAHLVIAGRSRGLGWPACLLAALLEDRDVLRTGPGASGGGSGGSGAVGADVAERIRLIGEPRRSHPAADRAALATARRRAGELARRSRIEPGPIELDRCGPALALAYPDRIAQASGGAGRFRLRSGHGVTVADDDPLRAEAFLVVAELGPAARSGRVAGQDDDRIRLAAALDAADVEVIGADDIVAETTLTWDPVRDDLVARSERRLDALVLSTTTVAVRPGPATVAALVDHVRAHGLDRLSWPAAAASLQRRAAFARSHEETHSESRWPDVSDEALLGSIDEWLPPLVATATGRADLGRVDGTAVLRTRLGGRLIGELDRVAPPTVTLPSGRAVRIDYEDGRPTVAVRVQELFGLTTHPTVGPAGVPVVVHLLSPAGRPIQVTADVPGFWRGSWGEVRKEMAGRYPKHNWPADPVAADPSTRARRAR